MARDPQADAVDDKQPGSAATEVNSPRSLWDRVLAADSFVLLLTVGFVIVMIPFTNGLLSTGNLLNILSNYWPLLLVVVGQAFVLITAGIDLSQTGIIALSNVVGVMLVVETADADLFGDTPFWNVLFGPDGGVLGSGFASVLVAFLVMVLIGSLIGMFNGWAVSVVGMPAFMVTLTVMMFVSALAIWTTRSDNVRNLPPAFAGVSNHWVAGAIAVTTVVAAHLILSRTLLGRWLYAIGINPSAAKVTGIPVTRVVTAAYALSGAYTALAAILYAARLGAGRPTLASDLLIDVIGAAVIGGVSLMGGRGRISGAAYGALFFVVLTNALNLVGLTFDTIMWVKGFVILGAVSLDVLRTRRERGNRS